MNLRTLSLLCLGAISVSGCTNGSYEFRSGLLNYSNSGQNSLSPNDPNASGTVYGTTIALRRTSGVTEVLSGTQSGTYNNPQNKVDLNVKAGDISVNINTTLNLADRLAGDTISSDDNRFTTGSNPVLTGAVGYTPRDINADGTGSYQYVQYFIFASINQDGTVNATFEGVLGTPTNLVNMPQFNKASAPQIAQYVGSTRLYVEDKNTQLGYPAVGRSRLDANFATEKAVLTVDDFDASAALNELPAGIGSLRISGIDIDANAFEGGSLTAITNSTGQDIRNLFDDTTISSAFGYFYGYSSSAKIPDEVGGNYKVEDSTKAIVGAFIGD